VLPFDHFQCHAQIAQKRHGKILAVAGFDRRLVSHDENKIRQPGRAPSITKVFAGRGSLV
jgi:hypothetical protein